MSDMDYVICGGRIIDPSQGLDYRVGNLAVQNGRISAIEEEGPSLDPSAHVVHADGCIVMPGLIDCHVHAYEHATPLGVNVDEHCLARGVTTVVDAGSAGASTFPGLRKFIAERCKTRILCFLHVATHGLSAAGCAAGAIGGECDHLNQVNEEKCVERILQEPDMIVGVKVRLSDSCTDNGRVAEEVFRRALRASQKSSLPLMVHHVISSIPVAHEAGKMSCPLNLKSGDILTHTFHPCQSNILDAESCTVHQNIWEARKKGVYFDLGHGQGSFSWTVAEICTKEGFWPDIISTDLHSSNTDGPAYDLVTVMTKMYALGMSLNAVIAAVTSTPAAAIRRGTSLGSLRVGREADITVLKIEDCDLHLEDCHGQTRRITHRFVPVYVWRAGKQYDVSPHTNCPNIESRKRGEEAFDFIQIHDGQKPSM